jgi:hypothetical protein
MKKILILVMVMMMMVSPVLAAEAPAIVAHGQSDHG